MSFKSAIFTLLHMKSPEVSCLAILKQLIFLLPQALATNILTRDNSDR